MLTAKGEEADIVKGLNMGADDYVTKPFKPEGAGGAVAGGLAPRSIASRGRRRGDRPANHHPRTGDRFAPAPGVGRGRAGRIDLDGVSRVGAVGIEAGLGVYAASGFSTACTVRTMPSRTGRWTYRSSDCAGSWARRRLTWRPFGASVTGSRNRRGSGLGVRDSGFGDSGIGEFRAFKPTGCSRWDSKEFGGLGVN